MIPHHKDAVTMAELAPTRSQDPDVLRVAELIRTTQQPQIDTMIGWMQGTAQPTAPPDFDTGHHPGENTVPGTMTFTDMVRLRESSGARFDRRFLTGMIRHHRGTIMTAKTASAYDSPETRALAEDMIMKQQAELVTMKKIQAGL